MHEDRILFLADKLRGTSSMLILSKTKLTKTPLMVGDKTTTEVHSFL